MEVFNVCAGKAEYDIARDPDLRTATWDRKVAARAAVDILAEIML
jgi:hypothetical protein